MTWNDAFDTVCVGSGAGGITAAIATAAYGGRPLVLEKGPRLGGVTAYSGGQIWFPATRLAAALGIVDSLADASLYLEHLGSGYSQPAARDAYLNGSVAAEAFLSDLGVELEVIRGLPDYFYPHAPGSAAEGRYLEPAPFASRRLGAWLHRLDVSPHGLHVLRSADREGQTEDQVRRRREERIAAGELCSGTGLMAWLLEAAVTRAVDFRTDHRVVELVRDGQRVVGVVVDTPLGVQRIQARRGVVLATGGYDWNPEMVRTYEHLADLGSMAPPTIEGDHLTMAGALGAAIESFPSWSSPVNMGFLADGISRRSMNSMGRCANPKTGRHGWCSTKTSSIPTRDSSNRTSTRWRPTVTSRGARREPTT